MPTENILNQEGSTHSAIENMVAIPPGWLLHSGISILAIVVIVLLSLSALVEYPDKVTATGVMTSSMPPIGHVNKMGATIDSLYVVDGDTVKNGQILAYLKNSAVKDDLSQLSGFISKYQKINHIPHFRKLYLPDHLQVGELTPEYARLQLLYEEFQSVLRQPFVFRQIKTLKKEMSRTKDLQETLLREKNYSAGELALIQKDMDRDSFLLEEGAISQSEKELGEGELLRYRKQYNNLDIGLVQNGIQQEKLQLEIEQLTKERAREVNQYRFAIQEVINQVKQQIVQWEEDYYIKAKIAGRVVIPSDISQEKYVAPNTEILSIIPQTGEDEKFALVATSSNSIGKIAAGDKVILKIDGYPYKEFGLVTSHISKIGALPRPDKEGSQQYEISIPLTDTLTTNFGKKIIWKPQLGLAAEVITKEKSILERITEPFLNLL